EARVRSIILTPAIAVVWILGLMLAFNIVAWPQGGFMAKFPIVLALSGYQGWLTAYGKKLANGLRPLSSRAIRMINEIPGVAAAVVVVLVIVRPF
ncbi:MAG: CopD family protein, partial [Microvirga sp.]